ncbi:ankyrin repeat-containing domain protein [Mucor mucedo]|uniref:ankyrin repeat-containing domain protein n=1 Tax=Mucor mucedo TaxID=29922 RepID=UPI002220EC8E|nr:ankyrin repeat-containing domain protein [Mucor mucedo]KAI7896010.1 ankyrin repeat-containing domain protein [Mucor mucedo]
MTPPTTVEEHQYTRNLQRMQLFDISENDAAMQHQSKRSSPKENLANLTQHISNEDLKQAVRLEIKKMTTEYDRLISMLQQRSEILEQEYENLQMTEDNYQRRYEKAVREMQFYKKKYDKAAELNKQFASMNGGRPRSPSMDSNNSFLLDKSHYGATPTSPPPSSVSGSEGAHQVYNLPPPPMPTSPLSPTDKVRHLSRSSSSSTTSSNASGPYWSAFNSELSPAPPVPRLRQNSNNGSASVHSASTDGDNISFLQGRKGSWQLMQAGPVPASIVPATPIPTVTRSATTTSQAPAVGMVNPQVVQQRRVDPIAFGGSDAFWETIAKSKTTDSTIEKMISNFLRRGGSPNTAKQSSSQKVVKYGYGMLHTLIAVKAPQSMELLLAHGANPNAMTLSQTEEDKVTPGYLAASLGWLPGLQTLVEAGADLTTSRGAVEYIVSLTPPKYHSQVDSMGASALHYAAASGHTDLVLFLVQACQLPLEQADIRGETPLHWASRQGHLEVATLLIERFGCDFNSYIPRKLPTPYDLAKSGGHKRLVEYYKKIGGLTSKKMDKKKEEELAKVVPVHLESALSKNGLFGF